MKTRSVIVVAERVALGEELGDLAEHAADVRAAASASSRCRSSSARRTRDADPGMGFASRMTAGAQHRITVRRRQRYAAVAGVAVAAAAAIAMLRDARARAERRSRTCPVELLPHLPAIEPDHAQGRPLETHEPGEVDDDVRALVHLANVDRSRHISAHWGRIEKSLAPYRAVLKGTEP